MPQMQNITVKGLDGTTDVVFSALSPAGQDGTPAVWRHEQATLLPGQRIRFEMSARWNANKTARKVSYFLDWPITRATSVAGVVETSGRIQCRGGDWIYPQNASDGDIANAARILANLLGASLPQSVLTTGYAPN